MKISEEVRNIIELSNPWWFGRPFATGIQRSFYESEIQRNLSILSILFILGPRRVGKTTLIFRTIKNLIEQNGVNPKEILFLSLDNPTFSSVNLEVFITKAGYKYVFLDEVQYYENWQVVIKSLFDNPSREYVMICSGSAASLISDKTSYLTGRTNKLIVSPLEYREFKKFSSSMNYPSGIEEYLEIGGYPEYVLERKPNYHNDLFADVVQKDIVELFKVTRKDVFFDICTIVAKQIGYKSSYNKLSNVIGLSIDTTKSYIEYLSRAYVLSSISKYSPSVNDRIYSAKKFYFYDTGMRNSFVGFEDMGSIAENSVFINLNRKYPNAQIFYISGLHAQEVDFLVINKGEILLIEVKYDVYKEQVLNKISKLFYSNVYDLNISKRIVVTKSVKDESEINGVKIAMVPLEEFIG